jgi:hypothetical protein
MPNIREILNNPEGHQRGAGLLTYVKAGLGGEWSTYQIRPWNFDVLSDRLGLEIPDATGWRLGLLTTEDDGDRVLWTQTVRIGFVIQDQDKQELQFRSAELAGQLTALIQEWSCCTQYLEECIEETKGGFYYEQNKLYSSDTENAWAIAVIREADLTYENSVRVRRP